MKILIILLAICLLAMILMILFFSAKNELEIINAKMESSEAIISENLAKKYEYMNKLLSQIKKSVDVKDFFKEFMQIKKRNLTSYELDERLNEDYNLMKKIKEDNNKIKSDLFEKINELDEAIVAAKKYFNKNNNLLMKKINGYYKIVAKIIKIYVKNSYDLKEPIDSNR